MDKRYHPIVFASGFCLRVGLLPICMSMCVYDKNQNLVDCFLTWLIRNLLIRLRKRTDDSGQLSKIQPDQFTLPASLDDDISCSAIGIGIHFFLTRRAGILSLQLRAVLTKRLVSDHFIRRQRSIQNGQHSQLANEVSATIGT